MASSLKVNALGFGVVLFNKIKQGAGRKAHELFGIDTTADHNFLKR